MLHIRGCKKGSNGNLAVSAPLPITAQTVDFFTISGSHVVLHKPVSNRKPLFYTHVITKLKRFCQPFSATFLKRSLYFSYALLNCSLYSLFWPERSAAK